MRRDGRERLTVDGMTTFTVWKFDDPQGAERAAHMLKDAQAKHLVQVDDHAIVSWPAGAAQPKTKHGHEDTWRGVGWGSILGVLIGSIFFVPVLGGLAGATLGAIGKSTAGAGISKADLEKIRNEITPGTSALFLVTEHASLDALGDRVRIHSTLLSSNLTKEEESMLLETFGGP
jgi:uncharacterized membrane protein